MTDLDSGGEEDAGPWTIGYRSCSSEYEDDLDDDDDDEHGRPKPTSRSLARDFDLIRELDLSLREDKVVFKETPFTLAQARKRDRSNPPVSSSKKRGAAADRGASLPRGSLAAVRAKEAEKKQSSKESGTVAEPWRTTRKQNAVPWWKKKQTVWRNSNGDPISPSNEDVEDQMAPSKSKKRSILEIADDATEKKGTTRKKMAASKQKGTADQDPIVFRKIPRGAAATGAFPILQGFERQKALSAKNNKKKTHATTQLSDDPSNFSHHEIDQLIKGNSGGPSSKPRCEVTITPSKPVRPLSDYALSQSRSQYIDTSKNANLDRAAHKQSSKISSQLPSFGNSGVTEPSHNLDTPQDSRSERLWCAGHSDDAQPSTMTHISDSWDKNPSSSTLPYSSPLDRQDARLAHPKPRRMANMTAMTARASRAKLEELNDSSQNTRYDDPQTSPLNARSSTKQPDAIDPYKYPFLQDDWSTLPHQQQQSSRKGNASRKTVYPPKTSAKFSMPTSFTQHIPQRSSQRAPSPHSHNPTSNGLKLTLFHPSPPKSDLRGSQNPSPDQLESSPFAIRNRYAQEIGQERQYEFDQADSRHDARPQIFDSIPAPTWQDKWGRGAHRSRDTAHTSEQSVNEMPPLSNRFSKFASAHPSLNSMATGGGAAFGGY